ncbi:MAG: hypothetical protein HY896_02855 [Deltaproteobacteria bacterium]|nr:hypothetical protein [Deltaproteobacteria bacterium]
MKNVFVIVALTVGLLSGSIPGASLAGEARIAGMADLSNAAAERTASDSMQAAGPIESGALPGGSGGMSMAGGTASADDSIPAVETGGVKHRVGLDTGP